MMFTRIHHDDRWKNGVLAIDNCFRVIDSSAMSSRHRFNLYVRIINNSHKCLIERSISKRTYGMKTRCRSLLVIVGSIDKFAPAGHDVSEEQCVLLGMHVAIHGVSVGLYEYHTISLMFRE